MGTNTLAYYHITIASEKMFILLTLDVNDIKLFYFVTDAAA